MDIATWIDRQSWLYTLVHKIFHFSTNNEAWIMVLAVAFTCMLVYLLFRFPVRWAIIRLSLKTKSTLDDAIFQPNVLNAVSDIAPAMFLNWILPQCFTFSEFALFPRLVTIYLILTGAYLLFRILENIISWTNENEDLKKHNLTVLTGGVKVVISIIAIILSISALFGVSLGAITAGLGASAAILLLVFQDTIRGFVGGIQLTLNGMLKKDDWIVCEKAGIDGEIEEVKLTTVKVRNWDNSISTIHPYTLITESFKNYQNMRDIGARRVCRSVLVDFTTVRRLTDDAIASLRQEGFDCPAEDADDMINTTLFRHYLLHYLRRHPRVVHSHKETSVVTMVRQLQPTADGLPLELYFFIDTVNWTEFETIQSDIFDHVYAAVNHFGLRLCQKPNAADFGRENAADERR